MATESRRFRTNVHGDIKQSSFEATYDLRLCERAALEMQAANSSDVNRAGLILLNNDSEIELPDLSNAQLFYEPAPIIAYLSRLQQHNIGDS